ncbi:MAG: MlaD family protein [Planctomycetota bacterium]
MNNNRQRQLLLGIFFVVALSILAYYTLFLTGANWFKDPIVMNVYFPEANGLREGAEVQLLGMKVGRVKELTTDTRQAREKWVHAVLHLDQEIELMRDATITIRETSLLGGRHVDINPGEPGGIKLEITEDQPLIGKVYKNPIDSFGDLGALIAENRPAIRDFLDNLDVISTNLREGKGTVGRLLMDEELSNDVKTGVADAKTLIANAKDASEQLKNGQGLLGALFYDPAVRQKFDGLLDNLATLSSDLKNPEGTLGALIYDKALKDRVATGIEQFVAFGEKLNNSQGTLGMLLSDPQTKEDVRALLANLGAASTDIKELVAQVKSGEGTVGKLLSSNELYDELKRTLLILNRSLEDFREAAPITAFSTVLFGAM